MVCFFFKSSPTFCILRRQSSSWHILRIVRKTKLGEKVLVEETKGRLPAGPTENDISGNLFATFQMNCLFVQIRDFAFVDLGILSNGFPEIRSIEQASCLILPENTTIDQFTSLKTATTEICVLLGVSEI